jgi:hypothetical protein
MPLPILSALHGPVLPVPADDEIPAADEGLEDLLVRKQIRVRPGADERR